MNYVVAVLPWVVEGLWLWLWVPTYARRLRKQRELEAMFGPGFFDMTQRLSEVWWLLVFGLYHQPLMLVGLSIPTSLRTRWPGLPLGLVMLGTPVLYSALVLWLA